MAYQRQLQSQRRALHGAVGVAIEGLYSDRLDELVDMLAYHFARSDDDAKARHYLLRAAQRADHLYANDEALAYFRDVLERSEDDPEARAIAFEGIGDVQRRTGAYEEALASFASALELRLPRSMRREPTCCARAAPSTSCAATAAERSRPSTPH